MRTVNIPFSVIPPRVLVGPSRKLIQTGRFVSAFFPGLHDSLLEAGYELPAREYAALALTVSLVNVLVFGLALTLVVLLSGSGSWLPAIAITLALGVASFTTAVFYPQIIARRRQRALENQLIPALRQLLIELRSGVPLFNAMASLTTDYGEVSEEFRTIVRKINAGTSDLDALSEATASNPSQQFRNVLLQISNALKVGSDLGNALEAQVTELTRQRVDQIRRYGQELSPWTMIYMMAAVIIPSVGVAMLTVIVGFLNISIPSISLVVILIGLICFQVFFLNFVASRRPAV